MGVYSSWSMYPAGDPGSAILAQPMCVIEQVHGDGAVSTMALCYSHAMALSDDIQKTGLRKALAAFRAPAESRSADVVA